MSVKGAKGETCPICGTALTVESATTRPFCSERCRTIDLGNWLGEAYRIPVDETPSDEPGLDLASADGDDS